MFKVKVDISLDRDKIKSVVGKTKAIGQKVTGQLSNATKVIGRGLKFGSSKASSILGIAGKVLGSVACTARYRSLIWILILAVVISEITKSDE